MRDNEERTSDARAIVNTYVSRRAVTHSFRHALASQGPDGDARDYLVDLIADIYHLAYLSNMDVDYVARVAKAHADAELSGEA